MDQSINRTLPANPDLPPAAFKSQYAHQQQTLYLFSQDVTTRSRQLLDGTYLYHQSD